jgi:hypothetical protein
VVLAMTDKALCEYLKQYRRGQESAASSKELEAAFHVRGTELRRAVNRLRCDGHPICSDATGYFYAARKSEIRATIAQLTGRISKIAAAKNGLLKSYQE